MKAGSGGRRPGIPWTWAIILLAVALATSYCAYCLRPFLFTREFLWDVDISRKTREAILEDVETRGIRFPAKAFTFPQFLLYLGHPWKAKVLDNPTALVEDGAIRVFCNGAQLKYTMEGEPVGWIHQGRATIRKP